MAVLRESLSNVLRHAQVTTVKITVTAGPELILTAAADGPGPLTAPGTGNGLPNMATRATALGGHCAIAPPQPRGAIVEWRVPLRHGSDQLPAAR